MSDKTPAEKIRERARELAGSHTDQCNAAITASWAETQQDSCDCGQAQRAEEIAALIEAEGELRTALGNVYALARREANRPLDTGAWGHILRFCADAGLKPNILRTDEPA